jgi:hypothetical protein
MNVLNTEGFTPFLSYIDHFSTACGDSEPSTKVKKDKKPARDKDSDDNSDDNSDQSDGDNSSNSDDNSNPYSDEPSYDDEEESSSGFLL